MIGMLTIEKKYKPHKYKSILRCCKAKLACASGDVCMWAQDRKALQEQTAAQRWWEVLAKPDKFPLSLKKSSTSFSPADECSDDSVWCHFRLHRSLQRYRSAVTLLPANGSSPSEPPYFQWIPLGSGLSLYLIYLSFHSLCA